MLGTETPHSQVGAVVGAVSPGQRETSTVTTLLLTSAQQCGAGPLARHSQAEDRLLRQHCRAECRTLPAARTVRSLGLQPRFVWEPSSGRQVWSEASLTERDKALMRSNLILDKPLSFQAEVRTPGLGQSSENLGHWLTVQLCVSGKTPGTTVPRGPQGLSPRSCVPRGKHRLRFAHLSPTSPHSDSVFRVQGPV